MKKGSAKVKGGTGAQKTIASGQRIAAAQAGTTDLAPFPVQLLVARGARRASRSAAIPRR